MERIELVAPTNKHKNQVMEYRQEFLKDEDSMDGTGNLRNFENFNDWLNYLADNSDEKTVRDGLVPAILYLAIEIETAKLVGMIDIRYRLNEFLLKYGGHIGYSIRRAYRNQGFGTEMLGLALDKCREKGMGRVLITCDKENIPSAKIIIKNGGILEDEITKGGRTNQRYWIDL